MIPTGRCRALVVGSPALQHRVVGAGAEGRPVTSAGLRHCPGAIGGAGLCWPLSCPFLLPPPSALRGKGRRSEQIRNSGWRASQPLGYTHASRRRRWHARRQWLGVREEQGTAERRRGLQKRAQRQLPRGTGPGRFRAAITVEPE